MTAREISELLGGELVGDGDVVVTRLRSILSAGKGDVTFLARATYAARAVTCAIGPTGHSGADLTNTYALTVGEIVAVQIVSTNVTAAGCAISLDITYPPRRCGVTA